MKLDQDQAKFLSRAVAAEVRRLEATLSIDPKKVSQRRVDVYKKLKVKVEAADIVDVTFSKLEKKEISNLIKEAIINSMSTTIPEYEKRQRNDPERSNFYQEYINKEKNKIEALKSFQQEIESL